MALPAWVDNVLKNGLPSTLDQAVTGVLGPTGALPAVTAPSAAAGDTKPQQTTASNAAPAVPIAGPAPVQPNPYLVPLAVAGGLLVLWLAMRKN